MALAGEGNAEEPVYGSALWKYDLRTGACWEHQLGDGVRGAEPVFAPRIPDAAEDDGWVIALAHDTTTDESRFVIIDGRTSPARRWPRCTCPGGCPTARTAAGCPAQG